MHATSVPPSEAAAAAAAHAQAAKAQDKFAWNAERIDQLLKMDTFTARHEDHTRKLLWTLGTDPHFRDAGNRSVAKVTPQNFPHVCDRFGIECDEQQAQQIFKMHRIPQGRLCAGPHLALIDSPVDTANLVRDQARRMQAWRARRRSCDRARRGWIRIRSRRRTFAATRGQSTRRSRAPLRIQQVARPAQPRAAANLA